MIPLAPILQMRGVAKSFLGSHGAVHVLRSVDLALNTGEFLAVTGPSGSGKTTLLNLAALLDQPTSGEIFFRNEKVTELDQEELAVIRKSRVGMVFQNFCLLPHRSALENVAFRYRYLGEDPTDARAEAMETLDALGLASVAHQPVRLLSGGEMQRVAIARAVAVRPQLLVADEPTGNLDASAAEMVMDTFSQLNQDGITVLLVTHNTSLLRYCSRHVVCDNGSICAA